MLTRCGMQKRVSACRWLPLMRFQRGRRAVPPLCAWSHSESCRGRAVLSQHLDNAPVNWSVLLLWLLQPRVSMSVFFCWHPITPPPPYNHQRSSGLIAAFSSRWLQCQLGSMPSLSWQNRWSTWGCTVPVSPCRLLPRRCIASGAYRGYLSKITRLIFFPRSWALCWQTVHFTDSSLPQISPPSLLYSPKRWAVLSACAP